MATVKLAMIRPSWNSGAVENIHRRTTISAFSAMPQLTQLLQ
jgi:hypothetical protein